MACSNVVASVVAMVVFLVSFWFGFTSFERQYEFFSLSKIRRRAIFKTVGFRTVGNFPPTLTTFVASSRRTLFTTVFMKIL